MITSSAPATAVDGAAASLVAQSHAAGSVVTQRFWFVLPEDSIKELMADPEFVAALTYAKVERVGSFWASTEFKRLNKAVGGVLTSTLHGVIDLGFDFAQPYNFVQHSTGLMFMR